MKMNVGKIDKRIRVIIGIIMIALGIYYHNIWGLLGLVILLTGLTGRCLLYLPFGITTCKEKK